MKDIRIYNFDLLHIKLNWKKKQRKYVVEICHLREKKVKSSIIVSRQRIKKKLIFRVPALFLFPRSLFISKCSDASQTLCQTTQTQRVSFPSLEGSLFRLLFSSASILSFLLHNIIHWFAISLGLGDLLYIRDTHILCLRTRRVCGKSS